MKENKNIPVGYKDSAVGVIPEEWEVYSLKSLTDITAGGTPSTSNKGYWGGDIKWMNSGELNLRKIYDTEGRITEEGLSKSSTKIIPANCVLIGLAGQGKTRGTVAVNIVELCTNQSIAAIYPNDSFIVYYLYYNLDYRYEEIRRLSTGDGGRGGLNLNIIGSLQIPLPSLSEQKKIAEILSTWDDAIERQSKLVDKLKLRKQALMQQLLTGKKRVKGFDEKWKEYRLGEIFERVTRKNNSGNTNIITISAQRGFVKQNDFFNKTVASEILDNYFLIYRGEFCYNKSYSNGYPLGATKRLTNFDSAVVTTLYICFKLRDQNYSGDFFEHFFEANLLNKGLLKVAHEGGRAHGLLNVTPNDFFNIHIKVPFIKEQTAIANILSTADKEIEIANTKLDKLREQKKGLMQQLLTGKKRVKLN